MVNEFMWSVVLWATSILPLGWDMLEFAIALMFAVTALVALATAAHALVQSVLVAYRGESRAWSQDPRRMLFLALGGALIFGMGYAASRGFASGVMRADPWAAALGCAWYLFGLLIQMRIQLGGRPIAAWWSNMPADDRVMYFFFGFLGPAAVCFAC